MPLMTSESTGVHWSVQGCVLLYTSCGAGFGISSSVVVAAVFTPFNFHRLGYTTHSRIFQLCLMKIHTDTHSGLSTPLALVLPYYFFIILLGKNCSTPNIGNVIYVEDNRLSLQGFSSVSSLSVLYFICLPPIRKGSEAFGF